MPLPLIGRLRSLEWVPLILGLVLVVLESVLRFVTSLLPSTVIQLFDLFTERIYAYLLPSLATKQRTIVRELIYANDFVSICELFAYEVEEHIVKTEDGYLLGVHRLRGKKNASTTGASSKPVVYLHHGLLMNSEVWVCMTTPDHCLPFQLADQGYDVWLGNNRGNKYSKKHMFRNPNEFQFWNFSMEEFAIFDIPNTIDYILDTTRSTELAYVGFSQGTAQAFAALSIHPSLNDKVKVFIGLAPAMAPKGIHLNFVDSLVKASPTLMYLFFGRRAILSSAVFWQSIMYPPLFVRLIDRSLVTLFDWHGQNIDFDQKLAAYAHLYSFTSVKTVVHWFQIMRNRCFQMFDDDHNSTVRLYGRAFYKVAQFPTRNIRSPIHLLYGNIDSLVDIDAMLAELPAHAEAIPVPDHEHLDIIWGRQANVVTIPYVLDILGKYFDKSRQDNNIGDFILQQNYNDDDEGGGAQQRGHEESQHDDNVGANEEIEPPRSRSQSRSPPPPANKLGTIFAREGIIPPSTTPVTGVTVPETRRGRGRGRGATSRRARAGLATPTTTTSLDITNTRELNDCGMTISGGGGGSAAHAVATAAAASAVTSVQSAPLSSSSSAARARRESVSSGKH
ncbi:lipase [Lipomyces japonicus]|uniref:lipase n=1 Tax=Lipomyces japonicus TaxID=56871 RepID=UPI0034CF70F3